jgi:hypothetical protein
MSLRGVVENLVATPSSQDRAFCSDTPGAAETMSEPTDAKPLDAAHSAAAAGEPLALLSSADAIALCAAAKSHRKWEQVIAFAGLGLGVLLPQRSSDLRQAAGYSLCFGITRPEGQIAIKINFN